ncbi:MAG: hypothetical protein KGD64_15170 [Candidatus Heimdallarchaeota archaeon]|nr:hypothetical protein [Candidatus Heimdallarchaeota archaeon]
MPRFIEGPSFNTQKRDLSNSSKSIRNSLLVLVLSGTALTIISILLLILVIPLSGFSVMELDILAFYMVSYLSELYFLNSLIFILLAITIIVFLGSFIYYLGRIMLHARNHFKMYRFEKQERKFLVIGLIFIVYTITSLSGFIPIFYLNTSFFLLSNLLLFLALLLTHNVFKDYRKQMRFIKKPSVLPLIGSVINILSWIAAYITILGIYGNLVGYIFIYLGFRKLSVDFKLISSESKIFSMDPSTPAPLTPIPKAPSIYNRTMIQEDETEPPAIPDTEETNDLTGTPSSLTETPSSLVAPKPLDVNQKLCPSCSTVLYKSDKNCYKCNADLREPADQKEFL